MQKWARCFTLDLGTVSIKSLLEDLKHLRELGCCLAEIKHVAESFGVVASLMLPEERCRGKDRSGEEVIDSNPDDCFRGQYFYALTPTLPLLPSSIQTTTAPFLLPHYHHSHPSVTLPELPSSPTHTTAAPSLFHPTTPSLSLPHHHCSLSSPVLATVAPFLIHT